MKVCPNCGWEIPDKSKKCPGCGTLAPGEKEGFFASIFGSLKKKAPVSDAPAKATPCTEKRPSAQIDTHEYPVKELTNQQNNNIARFEDCNKTTFPSKNGLYVAEILLLEYCSYGSYPRTDGNYPGFWWHQYGIRDVNSVLSSLENRGFIRFASTAEILPLLPIAELRELLSKFGLPATGKKSAWVERLKENVSEADLASSTITKKYTLTEMGAAELAENQYIPYMHKCKHGEITIWRMNQLMQNYPAKQWRDAIWGELNRLYLEASADRNPGRRINISMLQVQFLMEEDRFESAFDIMAGIAFDAISVLSVRNYRLDKENFKFQAEPSMKRVKDENTGKYVLIEKKPTTFYEAVVSNLSPHLKLFNELIRKLDYNEADVRKALFESHADSSNANISKQNIVDIVCAVTYGRPHEIESMCRKIERSL